jgi:hypothetical protein
LTYAPDVDPVVNQSFFVVDRGVVMVVYCWFWHLSLGVACIPFKDSPFRINYDLELLLLQDEAQKINHESCDEVDEGSRMIKVVRLFFLLGDFFLS